MTAGASVRDRDQSPGADQASPRAQPLAFADLPAAAFNTPRMLRFSDCDPAGIVYTPRFVDLMNGVIEDFFPAVLGVSYHRTIFEEKIGLGYAKLDVDFFRPGLLGDQVVCSVMVGRIGGASVALTVHIHRQGDEIARGRFVMVTTSLAQHRPIPVPSHLRTALVAYQDRCR